MSFALNLLLFAAVMALGSGISKAGEGTPGGDGARTPGNGADFRVTKGADVASAAAGAIGDASFPRLMGMNIGTKNYNEARYQRDLARLDIVILNFYSGWRPHGYAATSTLAIRKAVQAIKAINPRIIVGQYTVLNEAHGNPKDIATHDVQDKLTTSRWWLLDSHGRKVQWTSKYGNWDINFTSWSRPDENGLRWPQWQAERNYAVFFRNIPEFDIVYLDNVMKKPRVKADWDGDGSDDDPGAPRILSAHYAGHVAQWAHIRRLNPKAILVGNTADADLSNEEWRHQLEGGFLEGLMGRTWSIESRQGWPGMMAFYRKVMANLKAPRIVGFNVHGNPSNYRFFRYAFASCLLDDGFFTFTDEAKGYSSVPWFDEYDHKLGRALSSPPSAHWNQGVWRRDFQNGVVLVNPTSLSQTIEVEPGLARLAGAQDPMVNDGSAARKLTLPARDGIVLRRVSE